MQSIIKKNINGILGTVVFHLLIVVIIMAARLSSVQHQYEERMLIEFEADISEEDFRKITESIQLDQSDLRQDYEGQLRRDIAVNVSEERPIPDEFKNMSSQDLSELDQRVSEILDDAANGIMPELEQPEIEFEPQTEIIHQENHNNLTYQGPTTITYDLPGRTHLKMPVPVYKCPDGGIVKVNIFVNRNGKVISASTDSSPADFNEACIDQMAIEAALGSWFNSNNDSPEVQTGTITFYFQNQ